MFVTDGDRFASPFQGELGLHLRDPLVAAGIAEEDDIVLREVRVGDVLVVFDSGVRAIVHGIDVVEVLEFAQRMAIGRFVPRCAVGRTSRKGSRKASSMGPWSAWVLCSPAHLPGFASLHVPAVLSRTELGRGFTLRSCPSMLMAAASRCRAA